MKYFVNKQKLPYTCGILSVFNLLANLTKSKKKLTKEDEEEISKKGRIKPSLISLLPSVVVYAKFINEKYFSQKIIIKGFSTGKLGENALDAITFFEKTKETTSGGEWKKIVLKLKDKKEIERRVKIKNEYEKQLKKEKIKIEKLTPSKVVEKINCLLQNKFEVCVMLGLQKSTEPCSSHWVSIPEKKKKGYVILDSDNKSAPYIMVEENLQKMIALLLKNSFPLEIMGVKII